MAAGAEVAGVTNVERGLFKKRLFARMLPLVRSGRLGLHHLEQYRATLVSAPIPGWLRADTEAVLDSITRAVRHPNYQYEQSLAGDFGGLAGIIDWVADTASTVWGAGKKVVTTVIGVAPAVGEVAERITEIVPAAERAWEERETIITAAPIVSDVMDVVAAAQKPVLFGLSPLMLGGIALAAWLVLRK